MEKKKGISNLRRLYAFGAEFMDVLTKGLAGKDWSALSELIDETLELTQTEWSEIKMELMDLDGSERKELQSIVAQKIDNSDEYLETMVEAIADWVLVTVDSAFRIMDFVEKQKAEKEEDK